HTNLRVRSSRRAPRPPPERQTPSLHDALPICGTPRDIEVWANNVIRKVGAQVFRVGDKQISCTCSVGIGTIDPRAPDIEASINEDRKSTRLNSSHVKIS